MTDKPEIRITVAGATGTGRTTILRALAAALDWLDLPHRLDASVTRDGDYPPSEPQQAAKLAAFKAGGGKLVLADERTPRKLAGEAVPAMVIPDGASGELGYLRAAIARDARTMVSVPFLEAAFGPSVRLLETIAKLRTDEETEGGLENDDNFSTVESLIAAAREIMGDPGYDKAPQA